jgi:hypothetical protein
MDMLKKPDQQVIKSAIRNDLRVIHMGIRRIQQRIAGFESQYGMETSEFLRRYRNDEITETLETIEWLGETKMLARLREDEAALGEVRFAD